MPYSLVGYATGGGDAPQFMEPVFSDGKNEFAQVCEFDEITNFVLLDEDIDILEHGFEAKYDIGNPKVYAVLDTGGRVISGDRNYVTRYLSQNKDNYIDKPYFYASVLEFCSIDAPELSFIKHSSELLEVTALSNSIRRFCQNERQVLLNSEQFLPPTSPVYWLVHSNLKTWNKASSMSGKDQNFVRLWLDFASQDSPRLVQSSKWGNLENIIEKLVSRKSEDHSRYLLYIFNAAEDYLRDSAIHETKSRSQIDTIGQKLGILSVSSLAERRFWRYSNRLKRIFKIKISENVASKKVSRLEVSMAVLFFKISIKIYRDEILENDDATSKITNLLSKYSDAISDEK